MITQLLMVAVTMAPAQAHGHRPGKVVPPPPPPAAQHKGPTVPGKGKAAQQQNKSKPAQKPPANQPPQQGYAEAQGPAASQGNAEPHGQATPPASSPPPSAAAHASHPVPNHVTVLRAPPTVVAAPVPVPVAVAQPVPAPVPVAVPVAQAMNPLLNGKAKVTTEGMLPPGAMDKVEDELNNPVASTLTKGLGQLRRFMPFLGIIGVIAGGMIVRRTIKAILG